jgi:hypothetical protein
LRSQQDRWSKRGTSNTSSDAADVGQLEFYSGGSLSSTCAPPLRKFPRIESSLHCALPGLASQRRRSPSRSHRRGGHLIKPDVRTYVNYRVAARFRMLTPRFLWVCCGSKMTAYYSPHAARDPSASAGLSLIL